MMVGMSGQLKDVGIQLNHCKFSSPISSFLEILEVSFDYFNLRLSLSLSMKESIIPFPLASSNPKHEAKQFGENKNEET